MALTKHAYCCPRCAKPQRIHDRTCSKCGFSLEHIGKAAELPDILFNKALAEARQKQWAEARRYASGATALRPTDSPAWLLLGKTMVAAGDVAGGIQCFQVASLHSPGDPRVVAALKAVNARGPSLDDLKGL